MSSSNDSNNSTVAQGFNFALGHGTAMALAWIFFAPTGIFVARYGRLLRIGTRQKLLGETIWFQIHRLALSLAALATLLGFFLILVATQGTWVDLNSDGQLLYAHSIMGVLIVSFAMTQVWMALFRCHPNSKFRFIYNWLHRTTGLLAFILSIPTIFTIAYWLPLNHNGLVTILSIWTAWIVIAVISFEFIQHRNKTILKLSKNHHETRETAHEMPEIDHQQNNATVIEREDLENDTLNKIKLLLLIVHVVISVALVTALIILIWQQN